eukprot:1597796-Amphidinium_carterae.1
METIGMRQCIFAIPNMSSIEAHLHEIVIGCHSLLAASHALCREPSCLRRKETLVECSLPKKQGQSSNSRSRAGSLQITAPCTEAPCLATWCHVRVVRGLSGTVPMFTTPCKTTRPF